jgi:hypothetical protein
MKNKDDKSTIASHESGHACCLSLIDQVNVLLHFWVHSRVLIHDLKNPLAGVFGTAQVLADEFSDGDPRKTLLDEMMLQMTKMDEILNKFLHSTRNLEPNISPASLNLITTVLSKELEYHCGIEVESRPGADYDLCNLDPSLTLIAIYDLIKVRQHINNFSKLLIETDGDPANGRIVFTASAIDGTACSNRNTTDPDRQALLSIAADLLEREKAVVKMDGADRGSRFLEITFPLAERK